MTECIYHKQQYADAPAGIRTIRCAHMDGRYVHERVDERGYRWMNLVWESPYCMPALIPVQPNDDQTWNRLVQEMIERDPPPPGEVRWWHTHVRHRPPPSEES
jgi:hypothetical protein